MAATTSPHAHRKSRLQALWPLAIASLVIVASSRSRLATVPDIPHLDKITHFVVFGLLGTLVGRLGTGWRGAVGALLIVAAFGATDELHQAFVPGRTPELADWLADTAGAATGIALYYSWDRYRAWLESPLIRRSTSRA